MNLRQTTFVWFWTGIERVMRGLSEQQRCHYNHQMLSYILDDPMPWHEEYLPMKSIFLFSAWFASTMQIIIMPVLCLCLHRNVQIVGLREKHWMPWLSTSRGGNSVGDISFQATYHQNTPGHVQLMMLSVFLVFYVTVSALTSHWSEFGLHGGAVVLNSPRG